MGCRRLDVELRDSLTQTNQRDLTDFIDAKPLVKYQTETTLYLPFDAGWYKNQFGNHD